MSSQREKGKTTGSTTNLKNSDGASVPGYLQPTQASTSKLSQSTTNLSGNTNQPIKTTAKRPSKTDTSKTRQTKTSQSAAAEQLQTESEKPKGIRGRRKAESVTEAINEEHLANEITDQLVSNSAEQPVSTQLEQTNTIDKDTPTADTAGSNASKETDQSSQSNYENDYDDQGYEWEEDYTESNFQIQPERDIFRRRRSIERFSSDESLDDHANKSLFSDDSLDDTPTPDIPEETITHYTPRVPPINASTYNLYFPGDIDVRDEDIKRPNLEEVTEDENATESEIVTHANSEDEPKDDQEHIIITDKIITGKDGNVIFVLDKTTTYEFQTNELKESNGYVEKIKTSENKTQTLIDFIQTAENDNKLKEMFDEIFTSDEIAEDMSDILIDNIFIESDAYQTYDSFINDAHKYRAYRKYVNKELFLRVLNYDHVVYTEVFDEFYSYIKGREDFQNIIEDIKNKDTKTDITEYITKYMTPGEMIEDYEFFMKNSCIDKINKHRESKRITLEDLTEDEYKYNFIKNLIIDGYQIDINALNTNIKNKQLIENILTVMKNKTIELEDQMFEDITQTQSINTYDILEKVYNFYLVFGIYEEKVKVMEEFKNQLGTEKEIKDFNKYLNQKNIEHHALEYVELGNNRIFDIEAMEEELNNYLSEGEENEEEKELILEFIQTHFEKFVKIVEEKEQDPVPPEPKNETPDTPQQNQNSNDSPQPPNVTPNIETDSSDNEPKNDSTHTDTSLIQENADSSKRKMSKGMFIFLIVNAVIALIGLIIMVGVLIYRYKKRNALKAPEHENNEYDLKELFEDNEDNIDVTFE